MPDSFIGLSVRGLQVLRDKRKDILKRNIKESKGKRNGRLTWMRDMTKERERERERERKREKE